MQFEIFRLRPAPKAIDVKHINRFVMQRDPYEGNGGPKNPKKGTKYPDVRREICLKIKWIFKMC